MSLAKRIEKLEVMTASAARFRGPVIFRPGEPLETAAWRTGYSDAEVE
jgi:hypothetical protein